MQARARLFLFGLLAFSIAACSEQKAWVYRAGEYPSPPGQAQRKTVVVLPFDDLRTDENHNLIGLGYIPLFPYGWVNYSAPEGAQMHVTSGLWINYKPTEDFPKALAQELTSTGRYKDAYFNFKTDPAADYVIKGQIINTDYRGTQYTYGLSAYGPFLWLLGLPAATVDNDLSIRLTCTDKTGASLFSQTYAAPEYHEVAWIYALPSDFQYASMLGGLYGQFVKDLGTAGKCT